MFLRDLVKLLTYFKTYLEFWICDPGLIMNPLSLLLCFCNIHSVMKEAVKRSKQLTFFDSLSYSICSGNISYPAQKANTDAKGLVGFFSGVCLFV